MFVVPSTLQVLLATVLLLLGVCGNLVIPFVSYRTTLRCPHLTVLAALDFTATLFGPGVTLVTIVIGPTWLEHNKALCLSLSFLSSWTLITCFLVLFVLAVFCQKVRHNIHPDGRSCARRREFVFLASCLFTGLLLGVPPLLGWDSYNGLAFLHSCTLLSRVQSFSNYSVFYLASSLVVISVTFVLAVRALNQRRLYPLKLFWERHKIENRLNDPEVTTDNLSSGQPSSGSVRSRVSSILSGKRSVINSPMASRRLSQHSRSLDSLGRSVLLSTVQTHTLPSASTVPQLSGTLPVSLRDPYVISTSVSSIHPILKRTKVFQSPRFLPQRFTTLQQR